MKQLEHLNVGLVLYILHYDILCVQQYYADNPITDCSETPTPILDLAGEGGVHGGQGWSHNSLQLGRNRRVWQHHTRVKIRAVISYYTL